MYLTVLHLAFVYQPHVSGDGSLEGIVDSFSGGLYHVVYDDGNEGVLDEVGMDLMTTIPLRPAKKPKVQGEISNSLEAAGYLALDSSAGQSGEEDFFASTVDQEGSVALEEDPSEANGVEQEDLDDEKEKYPIGTSVKKVSVTYTWFLFRWRIEYFSLCFHK
jgi:hypothetical protein